jgi:hypothetical protein
MTPAYDRCLKPQDLTHATEDHSPRMSFGRNIRKKEFIKLDTPIKENRISFGDR